jgi:cytosol alanyl aminopeptidase
MRVLVLCMAAFTATAAPTPPALRLGNRVHPDRYAVQLTLDPDRESFDGKIEIALVLQESASLVWLNGTGLEVQTASITSGGRTQPVTAVPGGEDFIGFSWPSAIPAGPATLVVQYRGKVSSKGNEGIFRVSQGEKNYIFTQFEAISARRAFPCFDEPSFKVPWQVTLHIPKGNLAFSNTPVLSDGPQGGQGKTIQFQVTKPLPSYLIAVAVGPFEIVQAGKAGRNQVPIRVIVPHGRSADAAYAAKIIPELLVRLEKYFDIPYPYEKLDSVAVPLFQGGAMEDAGLITYDDPLLLSKPDRESVRFQRDLASVAAHEMAHQWFGDLVTMAWWNDTWLNEAFATWMSSTILEQWKPEWRWEIDDLRDRLAAANTDGLASARRITQPAESNSDIANAFDVITYQKGGAVIGMFEANVGAEKFRKGVQNYLRDHAFKNGRTEDFLDALSAASTPATGPAFRTFLDQPGIPEVSVSIHCAEGSKPVATVTQKRSQPLGSELKAETWQIPVCLKFGAGGDVGKQCLLLKQETVDVPLTQARFCPEWVLPNAGANGYYRANYPGSALRQLLERGGDKLSLVEQVSVLCDALALTRTGTLPAAEALSVVPLMANSSERELVEGAMRIATGFGASILPESLRANQARFIRKTFGPKARELGWIGTAQDSDDTRLLRERVVVYVAIRGEDEELGNAAKDAAEKWLKSRTSLNRGMVRPVLNAAAFAGDRALFDQFRAAALESKDQEEREALLSAMGSFRSREIAQLALKELLNNDFDLRLSSAIFGNLSTYPETSRMPFEFVQAHFDELVAKAPNFGDTDFGSWLPYTASRFCSAQDEQDVQAFFGPRVSKLIGGPRNLALVIEGIRACTARNAKQQASLIAFYQQF